MTRSSIPLHTRWWIAIRPHSLGTALAPVLLGGAVAFGDSAFRPFAFAASLLGVTSLLIGVNLGNDYFDFRSGADPPVGGGPRPLQAGWLRPGDILIASVASLLLGGLLGIGIAIQSPPDALVIGIVGGTLGFFYTAPPLRLGYRGLGEIVVFLALGPGATLGTYIVVSGSTSLRPALAAIPIGLTVAGILHANNLRDFSLDARTGKRTLAVILGWNAAILEFRLLIVAAELAVAAVAYLSTPYAALGLLTLPLAWPLARLPASHDLDGRRLMRDTAELNLRLAVLLSAGFVLSRVVSVTVR